MWTIAIGIALGVLEMYILKKTISFVTADGDRKVVLVLLTFGKMALLLTILFLIAWYISLPAMIWCACGFAGTMITLAFYFGVKNVRKYKKAGKQGGGA